VTYITLQGNERKKTKSSREAAATTLSVVGVVLRPRLAGYASVASVTRGMRASDNRCSTRQYARALHKTAGRLCRARLSRSRSRSRVQLARALLIQPGALKCNPCADDLYLANARPRGRMSHVSSLCLYRSSRKYPAVRTRFDTYVFAQPAPFVAD